MISIEFAKRNIRRSPFQAIAASLVMFLTFFALLYSLLLASASQVALKSFESKPQVIAFFKDGTTQEDIMAIQNALGSQPSVSQSHYVSKEDALEIYRDRNKNDPALLELVTANILPASLEVSTKNPQDLKLVADILKREPVVDDVIFPEDVIYPLISVTKFVRVMGSSAVAFLLFYALIMIAMLISFKIRLKREEIEIMRLVGASNWYIRGPYIVEGGLYGLIAALFALVVFYPLVYAISGTLTRLVPETNIFRYFLQHSWQVVLMMIVAGLALGILSSLIAIRKHLKI